MCLGDVGDVVDERLVVLIDQHNHAVACCELPNQIPQVFLVVTPRQGNSVLCGQFCQVLGQLLLQFGGILYAQETEVHVQHGMLIPVVITLRDPQAVEQRPPPLKDGFQRREQQALAKATRPRKKVDLTLADQAVDGGRFIYVEVASLHNFAKGLDANRQWSEHLATLLRI